MVKNSHFPDGHYRVIGVLVIRWCIMINTLKKKGSYMKLYVGNLAYSVTKSDLEELFSKFGEVSEVTLITDKFSGRSKGFGFVEMQNNSDADAAIKALNESSLNDRTIKVNQAKPKEDRPQRRARY